MKVLNGAGETIADGFKSEAEACRWFLDSGRKGDQLFETGELMSAVTEQVLGITVRFDVRTGCVAPGSVSR
jgi:hypothetical protein